MDLLILDLSAHSTEHVYLICLYPYTYVYHHTILLIIIVCEHSGDLVVLVPLRVAL